VVVLLHLRDSAVAVTEPPGRHLEWAAPEGFRGAERGIARTRE
jgi:hypothetical protein